MTNDPQMTNDPHSVGSIKKQLRNQGFQIKVFVSSLVFLNNDTLESYFSLSAVFAKVLLQTWYM